MALWCGTAANPCIVLACWVRGIFYNPLMSQWYAILQWLICWLLRRLSKQWHHQQNMLIVKTYVKAGVGFLMFWNNGHMQRRSNYLPTWQFLVCFTGCSHFPRPDPVSTACWRHVHVAGVGPMAASVSVLPRGRCFRLGPPPSSPVCF